MSLKLKLIALAAVAGLLGACSTAEVAKLKVNGGAYEKGLHQGYIKLADAEYAEDDWPDGDIFVDRARAAAMGKPTGPEALSARKLKPKHAKPLGDARKRLMAALDAGSGKAHGALSAKAQVAFDCWMQEAEEDMQPRHIDACRNDFYGQMALLEGAMYKPATVKSAMPAPPAAPRKAAFTVYFGLDSAKVSKDGAAVVSQAVAFAKKNKASNIYVTGHTDRAGSRKYNEKLAMARASAVVKSLTGMKVKKGLIGTVVYGEDNLEVQTPDNKKEGRNRRVVISVLY